MLICLATIIIVFAITLTGPSDDTSSKSVMTDTSSSDDSMGDGSSSDVSGENDSSSDNSNVNFGVSDFPSESPVVDGSSSDNPVGTLNPSSAPTSSIYAVLADLYTSTTGLSWYFNERCMSRDSSVCNWYSVECYEGTEDIFLLNLYYNNLQGFIPSSISHLSSLTFLALSQNNLNGRIPTEMGMLTSLNNLYI